MLGCDIIEIERIGKSYEKNGQLLLDRILSIREQDIFFKRNKQISFLAGRFAAKEAVAKAFKTGIGALSFVDIEIVNGKEGEPVVYVKGILRDDIEISISHSKLSAIAVAVLKKTDIKYDFF